MKNFQEFFESKSIEKYTKEYSRKSKVMTKSVFVYGFARAGTSLACGMIGCLGIKMLTSEPTERQFEHNPKGMYEIPGHMGGMAKILFREMENSNDNKEIAERIREYVENELKPYMPEEGKDWGIKGFSILGQSPILHLMPNPHVVAIFRNPVDQAKSFQVFRHKNDGVITPLSDLLQEMCLNQAKVVGEIITFQNQGFPVTMTTYEGIKKKPLEEAERIAKFVGLNFTEEMKQRVLDFVEPEFHTWKHDGETVTAS